ncbi:asparagine synthase-related protein [Terracoccus luteus]|uniref:asparagine synthase (glutamine-hydrolyzing) n=1 Tax=Terracoccus luteus TaxID=53356 RepID=A0A839PXR4_9MICO|nr:asparagine synthase-related protein [Terracoccus luteus]MBB2985582.1 asparagine synthase (glutamine-hydrolyzing) [Terracoccus luteus]MCP2171234.1 asparagine synthase (glutamine-hydrolyzing) [Terracoccus luteus]
MCGIAGHHGLTADPSLLDRLGRCPWDEAGDGSEGTETATLGPVGLSAPVVGRSGRFAVALDGEVYNRVDVRRDLEGLGHTFEGEADWEVVLAAFVEWGESGFDRLEGAFAVAVVDPDAGRLTLARDHLGLRSLHLAQVAGDAGDGHPTGWVFASRLTALLDSGAVARAVDERTVCDYLLGRPRDERSTFVAGVERLAPGEVVTVSDAGVERRRFSTLLDDVAVATPARHWEAGLPAELRSRLADSVRRRLRAPAPVGVGVSGGLASGAVALAVDDLADTGSAAGAGASPATFSAVFPEHGGDDERAVEAVTRACRHEGRPHVLTPTPTEFKNDLSDLVRTLEEPVDSVDAYVRYRVAREASGQVAALLSGTGGLDLLSGRPEQVVAHLRARPSAVAGRPSGGPAGVLAAAREAAGSVGAVARVGLPALAARVPGRGHVPVTTLLDRTFVGRHGGRTSATPSAPAAPTPATRAGRLADSLRHGALREQLLVDERVGRRHGVRTRQPWLDTGLVRFAADLGDDALVSGGRGARVLREAVRDRLPASVTDRREPASGGLAAVPADEWFMRLKNHVYGIFLSEPFANRPWVDQTEVLHAFEGWIKGSHGTTTDVVWRLLNLELWMQELVDDRPADDADAAPVHVKTDYEANARKQLDLTLDDGTVVRRYPLRTELFGRDDDLDARTLAYVERFFDGLPAAGPEHEGPTSGPWHLFISEKIVAITQGRSFFIWDIKVGRAARVLSRYVTRTPAGIGLGSPFTMQLAIEEAGLARVLYASAGGFAGKLVGRRGLFYELVGGDIRAIDGPTEYSVYPANVSAKLAPKDPDEVAARLSAAIRARVPEPWRSTYAGTVVMDANDIGRNALGQDAAGDRSRYEAMFADNPLGQGSEQTPMALVFVRPRG